MVYYAEYASPVGTLLLTCDEHALTGLWMDRTAPEDAVREETHPVLQSAADWLNAYFRGDPKPPAFPLAPRGTPFQQQVWQLLLEIPYGKTRTYGDLARTAARLLGKEKMSAQAIGGAVGRNPISILIPCHRVEGADGSLTGYAGGLERKQWLLDHERRKGETV